MDLRTFLGGVDAAGDGEIGLDAARKNGDPMQAQQQLILGAELEAGKNLESFEVEIGLVETVEEDQAFGSGQIEAAGQVGEVREVRSELHSDRNAESRGDVAHQGDVGLLDQFAGESGVGRNGIDVELGGRRRRLAPSSSA